jgi:hypothetical protein
VKRALSAGQKKHCNLGHAEFSDSESEESDVSMNGTMNAIGSARSKPIVIPVEAAVNSSSRIVNPEQTTIKAAALGGALKRNKDGTVAVPTMQPRKPKKATSTKVCGLTISFRTTNWTEAL